MNFSRKKNFYVVMLIITALTAGFSFALQNIEIADNNQAVAIAKSQISQKKVPAINSEPIVDKIIVLPTMSLPPPLPSPPSPQKLANPPEIIKAVYVTGWSAATKSYLNYLTALFRTTEINAVVVDIKDYSGTVSYGPGGPISDIDALVRFFHNQGIYVIGRISVFEDPAYSKARPDLAIYDESKTIDPEGYPLGRVLWLDNHKLSWLDPASKEVWDYNVSLAQNGFLHGFDEINFDYIRFPSDGNIKNMGFPFWDGKTLKHEIIKEFFSYLRERLPDEKISADLFGQVTTNKDDMGIGQYLEDASDYFDYISPMVYPSHYINGFMGFANPAEYPYEIVKYSMESAISRLPLAKFRPWLQDFNMGADYNADMVRAEIKATEDALKENYFGFMLWNPSNIYTQEAVAKSE